MAAVPPEAQTRPSLRTSDGVTLSYIEAEPAASSKKPFVAVLVPGWSMPAVIWRRQIEYLRNRFHILALDPRGQGESEIAPSGYTTERRATDLKELLDRFPKALLIGWSLGALESLHYVHMFGGGRLAGMVLVDSSVGEEPVPRGGDRFIQELREDRDAALTRFARAMFAKRRGEEEIAELVQSARRMTLENSVALLERRFERSHWRNIARSFDKPLLYVVSRQFEAQAKNLKKNRPATQVAVFRNAGHALFVDEPTRFNRLIESFARRLE